MNIIQRWQIIRTLNSHFYKMSKDQLRKYQVEASARIWSFVRENSIYYRKLYPEAISLNQVVPMNRSQMMEHFNEINTDQLDRDQLIQIRISMEREGSMEYFKGYSVGLSSGTSGSRLLTVLSRKERDMYSCLLWARSGIPKSVQPYRVLFALRTYNPAFTEVGVFGVKIIYVDYFRPMEDLVRLVNEKRLNIIAGPPSLLLLIAGQIDRIDHPIEAIISYAEVLDENVQNKLQRIFKAPVVQIYQGAEGFIGSTCCDGHLHINEDVLMIEPVEDPAKGPTKVLVTDLFRRAQPFIRYELDDVLELDLTPCSCGSAFRVIKRIHGRADDVFVLFDKDGKPRYLFPDYVCRAINQSSEAILDFQAIQHSPTRMEIRLLLKDENEREQIEREVLNNLAWRVEKLGAEPGTVEFSTKSPERNPYSYKMVRVTRRFQWNF